MPIPLENLAMVESDWPGADWNCEKSTGQLAGPRRGEALSAHAPARLAKFHAPEIVFGPGALAELGHCAARLGARRPFLVTDPGLIEAGWVDEAVAYLRRSGLHPAVWHDVTPNPKDHEIEAAFQMYAESGSDVIIGLGGGSCIDAAKGVAILSGNGGRILDRAVDKADLRLDLAEVLLASRVGELVEHRHFVAVLADPQSHERRADEAGATADEQLHAAALSASRMYSARPAFQCGSAGAPRSLRITL